VPGLNDAISREKLCRTTSSSTAAVHITKSSTEPEKEKKERESVAYFAFPRILKTFVPQAGHSPFAARIPFFIVTSFEFFISTSFLHFMHLPFGIKITPK
jgi:hypothetical protein